MGRKTIWQVERHGAVSTCYWLDSENYCKDESLEKPESKFAKLVRFIIAKPDTAKEIRRVSCGWTKEAFGFGQNVPEFKFRRFSLKGASLTSAEEEETTKTEKLFILPLEKPLTGSV